MIPRHETTLIVIHCSATRPAQDIGVPEIRRWHVQDNGWCDIGYHFVVRRNGAIERGRLQHLQGAHAPAANAHSIGICLVGGIGDRGQPENNFTHEQFASLKTLIYGLWLEYSTITGVCGHRDLSGVKKACPSFDVAEWLQAISFDEVRP